MNNIKETLAKKDLKAKMQLSIVITILLILTEIVLCFWNKRFFILIWVPILPLIHTLKRNLFFKNAEFCYGKVIEVTLSENDDIYIY